MARMTREILQVALLACVFAGGVAVSGLAQRRQNPFPPANPRAGDDASPYNIPPKGPSRQLKMMKESFEQTKKDTSELYDLATQLKDEVDKADENTLAVGVVNKAESIEKLAEKIKNRMKNL
jgi:hypothetical protein